MLVAFIITAIVCATSGTLAIRETNRVGHAVEAGDSVD
jgi:hypothetical protein